MNETAQRGVRPQHAGGDQAEILEVVSPLRRFVASRVDSSRDADDIDDVVQETLTRVLEVRGRLEDVTLTAYAFTVARNLIATRHRDAATARRHAPRLLDPREPDQPDQIALAQEDRQALVVALEKLPSPQREQLLAQVVDERPIQELSEGAARAPAALAAQLARTRAKLRVDYLLALRHVELTSPRCRPILLAVSAGDRRRQKTLRAGPHLLNCATCAELSQPLLTRQRALAGLVPVLPLGAAHGWLARFVRAHPAPSVAAGAATVAGGAAAVALASALLTSPDVRPPTAPGLGTSAAAAPSPSVAGRLDSTDSTLVGPGGPVLPRADHLDRLVGRRVSARGVRVLAVAADEGFWVGDGSGARVWVQLAGAGESPERITVGQRLWFEARVVGHGRGFAGQVGVSAAEGAARLSNQRAHLATANVIMKDR